MPRNNRNTAPAERPKWSVALLLVGGIILLFTGLVSLMQSTSSSYNYSTNSYGACQVPVYSSAGYAITNLSCTPYLVSGILFTVLGLVVITFAIVMKHAHTSAIRKLSYAQMALTVITFALVLTLGNVFTLFFAASGSLILYMALSAIPFQFIGAATGITHF